MGSFSLWHWGLVLVIVLIVLVPYARMKNRVASYTGPGIDIYSPTQYVCAALHYGYLKPKDIIDRLENRHKARLPELGLNVGRILSEAKKARRRNAAFSIAALLVAVWIVLIVDQVALNFMALVMAGETGVSLLWPLAGPLIAMSLIGIFETLALNHYLRHSILPLNDAPDQDAQQNVSIYGGFSPFAGYGIDLDGWSTTLDTSKPDELIGGTPKPFQQAEMLDHLSRELEANVVQGESSDRLFVNGQRIRGQKFFLHENRAMPNTAVSAQVMASMIGKPSSEVRHYRLFSVPYAHRHVYVTFFLRSTMVGDNVFIESRCFILAPLRAEFTELNQLPVKRGFRYCSLLVLEKILVAPFVWLRGPGFVLSEGLRLRTWLSDKLFGDPEDKAKMRDETYNYGHENSLRATWASPHFNTYFQWLDRDMVTKTCQHIIMNSLVDFLASKGIDTCDIKEGRKTIFNSGFLVAGGVVNAQNLAVGTGATIKPKD